MDENNVLLKLNDHEHEIGSLKHRVDEVERKQDDLQELISNVNKLAINMDYMMQEQKKQGERLDKIEQEPAEDARYYKRNIITSIITGIIGAILGALIALIIK